LAPFLVLWITTCDKADPFLPGDGFAEEFDTTLNSWCGDQELYVPMPENPDTPVQEEQQHTPIQKDEFYNWAQITKGGLRRQELMRRMIVWLQFRSILIAHALMRCPDSSITLTENLDIGVQVA
jgi:hypothetical protein